MPTGGITVPEPEPVAVTVRVTILFLAKFAITDLSESMVKIRSLVPDASPLQPVKIEPIISSVAIHVPK